MSGLNGDDREDGLSTPSEGHLKDLNWEKEDLEGGKKRGIVKFSLLLIIALLSGALVGLVIVLGLVGVAQGKLGDILHSKETKCMELMENQGQYSDSDRKALESAKKTSGAPSPSAVSIPEECLNLGK